MHTDKHKTPVDFKQIFKRLFSFMKPYQKGLTWAVVLIVLASICNSISPFFLGKATDSMVGLVFEGTPVPEAIRRFTILVAILSAAYVLYAVFKYLSTCLLVRAAQNTIFDLRRQVDEKLKRLPLNYFDTNSYGDVLSRITNDVDTISNSLQQSLEQVVTAITSLIFIFVMMMAISPILTLIGLVTVPLALVFSMKIARYSQVFYREQQDTLGDLNGYVEEMYTGHVVISAFSQEKSVISEFGELNESLYQSGWKSQFLSSTLMPITQAMTNLGYVGVAVVSALLVIGGRLSIGMIQSFIQYLRQFSQPINQTVQIASVMQSTAAAGARIFEFLDEKEETADPSPALFPENVDGSVEFDHVKFGYLPYQTLMHDVSIHVKPGSKVAVVGPTGAGKTTLINLLLRFYDIEGGSIRISGVDVRQMERTKLREIFGMVLQDTWLFTGTIMENIRYGRLDASDQEVIKAAKAAHADSFIRALPGGYQMTLQEGAVNLAQGERQLLTIARAILSDAPIMILDEATSSVDTRTEVLIQEAMANLMKGRTSFVIAHRLSTIRDADMILYMENGDVKETGTHEELLKKNGLYAKLYNSQFAGEESA